MSWKITRINNATHTLDVTHKDGEVMTLVIPVEHRVSSAVKSAWVTAQIDARNLVKDAKTEETEIVAIETSIVSKVKSLSPKWFLLPVGIILLLLWMRYR